MQDAPFYNDLADGPEGGSAYWLTAQDGVRLRIGVWPKGREGTVLLFPGRTEYIEKYGQAARDLSARGFATLAVDWRGQGLADRPLENPMVGHVARMVDYQMDVREAVKAAEALNLPKPFFLLAHSMGGCIGLRALHNDLPVQAACFSGPMFDIRFTPPLRQVALMMGQTARFFGQAHHFAPSTTGSQTYVLAKPFEENTLTHDTQMWDYMRNQATAQPALTLGGPSLNWVLEALIECSALAALPAPDLPALTFLGEAEEIVSKHAIERQMRKWPKGTLITVPRCRHEIMMEGPALRDAFFDRATAFFKDHAKGRNAA